MKFSSLEELGQEKGKPIVGSQRNLLVMEESAWGKEQMKQVYKSNHSPDLVQSLVIQIRALGLYP